MADPRDNDPEIQRLQALACEGGEVTACEALGATWIQDPDRAEQGLSLLDRAYQLGSTDACALLRAHQGSR